MKNITVFDTDEDYWAYIHTKCTISTVCVLLSKPQWTNHKEISTEAIKIADEVVKALKKKHK